VQSVGGELQQEMLCPFVYIFPILPVEIRYFANKMVRVSWRATEKFICQTVDKLVNG
jgi:hypothetical protein